jgi:DNA-binding HxlR family transcriptional regulator
MKQQRSGCPINLALEILGDKWTLVVIRDIALGDRRHFRELLTQSIEGIPANMLSDRLKSLMAHGLVTKADDPSHKQKSIYSLTEQGIELLPVLAQMAIWGRKYLPASPEDDARAKMLEDGGPKFWAALMRDLRKRHLGQGTRSRKKSA